MPGWVKIAQARRRNPEQTRETLLKHAFAQIHQHGYRAVSLDTILRDSGVTKGALYHHFPSKQALGYAVVDEIIAPMLGSFWIDPLRQSESPIEALQQIIRRAGESMTVEELKLGCPLNNLSQEMSSIDEGFRERLDSIYEQWRQALALALDNGKDRGTVADRVDSATVATFLVAALEGCIGMAKSARSMKVLNRCGTGMLHYLETLKPHPLQP